VGVAAERREGRVIELTRVLPDPAGLVTKFIFEDETAVAETVAYRYGDRSVICFSVQSGCRVGCSFCGTGQRFVRNLTTEEIRLQIDTVHDKIVPPGQKAQLMAMSMGEPMDNWDNVRPVALHYLPRAQFFISTVGWSQRDHETPGILTDLLTLGAHPNFGLQFSLHHHDEQTRRAMLGNSPKLMSINAIMAFAGLWKQRTGKLPYFNYVCRGHETMKDAAAVRVLTSGYHLTCSVLSSTQLEKPKHENAAIRFAQMVTSAEMALPAPETSLFNPDGQDTIGGGCGQLVYVQEKMRATGLRS
jgi:23S rRNA (adenine2503-C2)-methyltransferase